MKLLESGEDVAYPRFCVLVEWYHYTEDKMKDFNISVFLFWKDTIREGTKCSILTSTLVFVAGIILLESGGRMSHFHTSEYCLGQRSWLFCLLMFQPVLQDEAS